MTGNKPFGFIIMKLLLLVLAAVLSWYFSNDVLSILLNGFLFVCSVVPDLFTTWWAIYHSTHKRAIKGMMAFMSILLTIVGLVQFVCLVIYPNSILEKFITKTTIIVTVILCVLFSLLAEIVTTIFKPKNKTNSNASGNSGTANGNGSSSVQSSSNPSTPTSDNGGSPNVSLKIGRLKVALKTKMAGTLATSGFFALAI